MKIFKEDFKETIYIAFLLGITGLAAGFFGIMSLFFGIRCLAALTMGASWVSLGQLIISGLFVLACWISIVVCRYVWERKDFNVFR